MLTLVEGFSSPQQAVPRAASRTLRVMSNMKLLLILWSMPSYAPGEVVFLRKLGSMSTHMRGVYPMHRQLQRKVSD